MDENQTIYEKEFNIKDMIFFCLKKWRILAGVILIVTAITGLYGYYSIKKNNEIKLEIQKNIGGEITEEIILNPNVERYRLAIEKYEEEIDKRKKYLEDSVIMQMNANHLQTGILEFYVDIPEGEDEKLNELITAYQAYVIDGRLAKQLEELDAGICEAELQNLISFVKGKDIHTFQQTKSFVKIQNPGIIESVKQIGSLTDETLIEIQMPETNSEQRLFMIQIIAPENDLCGDYLAATQNAILAYNDVLRGDIAEHKLKVLTFTQMEEMNQEIQQYQSSMLVNYSIMVEGLKSLSTSLDEILRDEGEYIPANEAVILGNPISTSIKYALGGFIVSAFFVIMAAMLSFIMNDRLQSVDRFEKEFGMKLVAYIGKESGKNKWFGFLDRWIAKMDEGACGSIPYEERVKIALANIKAMIVKDKEIKRVAIAGSIAKKDVEDICVRLMDEMKDVEISQYKQVLYCAADLEELDRFDSVLFLEEKGMSVSRFIYKERELAECRNIKILGVVVL